MVTYKKELEYKDFTPKQKKGIHLFGLMPSDKMVKWFGYYEKKTGKPAGNIHNKGSFYNFVANNYKKKRGK